MSWQDTVNGLYEFLGGVFVLMHCRQLYRDKLVKGVSLVAIVCFFTWGLWNLYYYPHLDQWASFWGGIAVCSANVVYIGMLVYYKQREKATRA